LIDTTDRPKIDLLPPVSMPQCAAGPKAAQPTTKLSWVSKVDASELRFHASGLARDFDLKPFYQVMDQRYSVYWQKTPGSRG
jgi:hypothetical protein